jgi:hypothetical protein
MAELVSIHNMPQKLRIELLKRLGYDSDGVFVLKDGEKYIDKYTKEHVKIDNMVILDNQLPGSTIILDNNSLSISSFLEEYGDVI